MGLFEPYKEMYQDLKLLCKSFRDSLSSDRRILAKSSYNLFVVNFLGPKDDPDVFFEASLKCLKIVASLKS